MSATARNSYLATLTETIDHDGRGGCEPMPEPTDKASAQRYTFTSGSRPLDGFTIKRAIGRGGFGEVYYATSDAGKEVALKLITRNLEVERRGVVQCMNLKSPHLVAIHDLKQNDEGDSFVIMEFVSGPSLAQILAQHPTGLPAVEIRMWLKGLVDGVGYLHDHGIVHRDLKPANLFLEEGVVKIGDYGLSKAITGTSRDPGHSECVGTCHYMAPETSTGKYHKPIDVYAIGVILYEMVTGRVPFDGESVGEVLMKHLTSRPDLSVLPEPFKSIVGRAVAKDPNHRPQRVTDLLLPGDAPKEPAMRFIGEKSSVGPNPVPPEANGRREDVLRITDEEPVFFIGPDTRPPRANRPRPGIPWLRAFQPVARAVKAQRAALRPQPTRAATPPPRRPEPPRAVAPPRPAPEPPKQVAAPPPPPLPSTRVRLAELSGSMLMAAPLAAIGTALMLPLMAASEHAPTTDPRGMAVLFGVSLILTWGFLAMGKPAEGRRKMGFLRLPAQGFLGALAGLAGLGLAVATGFQPSADANWWGPDFIAERIGSGYRINAVLQYAMFFALVSALGPWSKLLDRDRRRRLKLWPIAYAAILSVMWAPMFSTAYPASVLALPVAITVAQLVSPWSREAAAYTRAVRKGQIRAAA